MRGLVLVQLTWITALALVVATTTAIDGPSAMVGASVVIVVLLALAGQSALPRLHSPTESTTGPPPEEQRLRGAFRRQSAPDTPGRPGRPRAPGRVPVAA